MSRLGGRLAPHAGAAVLHRDLAGGAGTRRGGAGGRPGLGEALGVWALFGIEALAVLVTYARLPVEQLYAVDEAGTLLAGAGRTLVLLNYPIALAAIALAALAGGPRLLVAAAVGLCAIIVVPGVVDSDDLDARWINVVPAVGVALALALTVAAVRRDGAAFVRAAYGDRLRLVVAGLIVLVALPWLTAEAGFHFPGDVFLGEEIPAKRDEGLAAVHLGFHHGNGGALLALASLALSRAATSPPLAAYLSGLFAYGFANAFQDAWNEQLWKREWVAWHVPSVDRPELSVGWLLMALGAAVVYALWFRPGAPR